MITGALARYMYWRFARAILLTFAGVLALIYLIDVVELLRRAGDAKGVSASFFAFLSLLRVPAVAEQILPFAVLFGAMAAFLGLTRKLELVVARAAGVSVWQFLTPPIVVALVLGGVSVALYNPMSAGLKHRADSIETKLFGAAGADAAGSSLWIRQKGVDGQAIVRAERSAEQGRLLGAVSAFVFDAQGRFQERIEAASARLEPGFWNMQAARIIALGEEPRVSESYLLATNLTAEQVTQSFAAPDTVSFWQLARISDQTEKAGLDATGYRLRYQTLLARPLLFVAMVLIAASFSLRFFRMGGVAKMVSGGVAAGFLLYVVDKLVADLGGAGLVSAVTAAWFPALAGCVVSLLVLLNQEDG